MARRTEVQLAQADLIDTIRTAVRLKYRIAQRHELNDLEAKALSEFSERVANGEPFRLDPASVFEVGE